MRSPGAIQGIAGGPDYPDIRARKAGCGPLRRSSTDFLAGALGARSGRSISRKNRIGFAGNPMKRAEKAEKILQVLDQLYPAPAIPLRHADPYTLLVAVVLSAQTTDARVNLVTPALFERAPTPAAMAALTVPEILAFVRTCGLAPAKAANIHRLSQLLLERHAGEVPASFAALEALPGVGHKTASVVMCQAFGVPAFPVDTHIHRLACRWGLADGSSVEHTERDLKAAWPESRWNTLHLQIIYFGREHCPALRHAWERCPICAWAGVKSRLLAEGRSRTA